MATTWEAALTALADTDVGCVVVAGDTPLTQLTHASGLGLWLMRWVVDAYGGRFDRTESDLGGTRVRLHLPG